MVVNRYIARELLQTMLAVALILLLISLSTRFVRFLGEAASGELPVDIVFTLIGLKSVDYLVIVFPLAFYLAALLTFSRMYRDSEMVALNACGVGPGRLIKSVMLFAPAVALVVAILSLYAAPWAAEKAIQMREKAEQASELSGLIAGQFRESRRGDVVFYVEQLSANRKSMENVFIQTRKAREAPGGEGQGATKSFADDLAGQKSLGVLSSSSGYRYVDEESGDQFVVMEDGFRYEGKPGDPRYKIIKFEKHGVRVEEKDFTPAKRKREAIPTPDLWDDADPRSSAEMQWRLSWPLSALLLPLLALPLSRTSPREGRLDRLFVAVLAYIIYNNMLGVARDMIAEGGLWERLGIWWVHGLLLLIVVALIAWQNGLRWCYLRLTGKALVQQVEGQ